MSFVFQNAAITEHTAYGSHYSEMINYLSNNFVHNICPHAISNFVRFYNFDVYGVWVLLNLKQEGTTLL